jgi:DNA invertase Pin-like site-specific DNA recombinase
MDIVIVVKLDRITRSVVDANCILRRLQDENVRFASIEESINTDSAMGRFTLNLFAFLAQLERETTSERTKATLKHLKETGQKYCREVFMDAEVIDKMKRLRDSGFSYSGIAATLNYDGVATARGGSWRACSVQKILARAAI